jgi:IS4 transposase
MRYVPEGSRRHRSEGLRVRVIVYQLDHGLAGEDNQTIYRLVTTLLEPEGANAQQLATLYAQSWEIEGLFDELKKHLRGGQVVLRSKTPRTGRTIAAEA